jgi:DNA-directed RNA polymerase specialized sigma24 family protein
MTDRLRAALNRWHIINAALDTLSPKARAAVEWSIRGKSLAEIAKAIGHSKERTRQVLDRVFRDLDASLFDPES